MDRPPEPNIKTFRKGGMGRNTLIVVIMVRLSLIREINMSNRKLVSIGPPLASGWNYQYQATIKKDIRPLPSLSIHTILLEH